MLKTPKRNRYFRGKLLDAYHFELEQAYLNHKRWMLNRFGLGSGILNGLEVLLDGRGLQIEPGVAIDTLGREIVLSEPSRPFDPRALTDASGNPTGTYLEEQGTVLITLLYRECETEPAPVLDGDCDSETLCEASTIEERYAVAVQPDTELGASSKGSPVRLPRGTLPRSEARRALFVELLQGLDAAPSKRQPALADMLEQLRDLDLLPPNSPDKAETGVPLARIDLPAGNEEAKLDNSVRQTISSNAMLLDHLLPLLSLAPHLGQLAFPLTTISDISWTHGGHLDLTGLNSGLTVTFSNPISNLPTDMGWLAVTVDYPVSSSQERKGGPTKGRFPAFNTEFPAGISKFPGGKSEFPVGTLVTQRALFGCSLRKDQKDLVVKPDQGFAQTFKKTCEETGCEQTGALCRILIKCNYLRDRDGRSVDGDYFGNLHFYDDRHPFGNGLAGGDFESWFTLHPKTKRIA